MVHSLLAFNSEKPHRTHVFTLFFCFVSFFVSCLEKSKELDVGAVQKKLNDIKNDGVYV